MSSERVAKSSAKDIRAAVKPLQIANRTFIQIWAREFKKCKREALTFEEHQAVGETIEKLCRLFDSMEERGI